MQSTEYNQSQCCKKIEKNLWREALKYLLLYTQPMILCWHNSIVTELDEG